MYNFHSAYTLLLSKKPRRDNVKNTLTGQFRDIASQFLQTTEKNHGRLEIRKHWIIDDAEHLAYLDQEGKWVGLQAIGMGEAERRIGKEVSKETRYYLLSFARDVERFATSVRS